MRRPVTAAAVAVASVAALTSPVPAAAATGPNWTACPEAGDPRMECATIRVPLDHSRPRWRGIDIAVSRIRATDPAQRRGVLVTTGGGPGGPGVPLPAQLSGILDPAVTARYDLIGFDLRFVERSTPITCGQPGEEPGGYWVRAGEPAEYAAEARRYADDCARYAGWALPYATTANAARDLDLIRAALGEPRISFIGGSSAAFLGTTYAALFPRRVDRFVLDSPLDGDSAWRPYDLERTPRFEANFEAFTGWLAENNATYGFGATPAEVRAALLDLSARAARGEVVAGGRLWTFGELGSLTVIAVMFAHLFPVVATNLAAIRAGAAPPIPIDLYPRPAPGATGVPADNHTAVSLAYRCGDNAWPRRISVYEQDVAAFSARFPVYGTSLPNVTPCAFWPVHRDNRIRLDGSGAPPMLFVAATRDASVPYADTVAAMAHFPGSRLVTVDAHTHVPFTSQSGGPAVNAAVTAFLTDGRL